MQPLKSWQRKMEIKRRKKLQQKNPAMAEANDWIYKKNGGGGVH
jgi:hypothetical protein